MIKLSAVQLRASIDRIGVFETCRGLDPSISTREQADAMIHGYVMGLLQNRTEEYPKGCYASAAIVLWGDAVFNPRPGEVHRIWRAIQDNQKTMILGCGSVGKSYNVIAFLFLDWLADPNFTNIKILSTTKGHALANIFSTLARLKEQACITIPGPLSGGYMGLDPTDRMSGIGVVAIPPGDDGKARLKGFHPQPRPVPHPVFGRSARVRAFMDECEDIPNGVWEGIDNMLLSMDGDDSIKVIGAYNPKDITSKVAQCASPPNGWESFDIETGVEGKDTWTSRAGWRSVRLDGAKSANVVKRKLIFPGFVTYEGYRNLSEKGGGNTPEYFSQARGAYPPDSANSAIITQSILARCRGEFVFVGVPVPVGGVDTAVDGRDDCIFTRGKCGMATAFKPLDKPMIVFPRPRLVVQADQQFECRKGDVKTVGDDIIKNARLLSISPEYLGEDATGNGAAVHAYIGAMFGKTVGVDFNENATDTKILDEDLRVASELYDGLVTEVWFSLRYWMEFGYFAISASMDMENLTPQILGRRYVLGTGKLLRVEKKDDYKKRLGRSPDHADSLTVFGHVARIRERVMGSMSTAPKPKERAVPIKHGAVDEVTWISDTGV